MSTIKNKLRSNAHKKYNLYKEDYKHYEERIIDYKRGWFGINASLLQYYRDKLNDCVKRIKMTKRAMSKFNREYNN